MRRIGNATEPRTPAPASTGVHGRWLPLARLAWIALAVSLLVMVVIAAPRDLTAMRTPCTGRICLPGQVHIIWQGVLVGYGLSLQSYGALMFALQLTCTLMYVAVAGFIFWRRPDDGMALLGAAMLLVWGVSASNIITVLDEFPPWDWGVRAANLLGTALLTAFFYLFPSGRFVPRWMRWLIPVWVAGMAFAEIRPTVFGTNLGLDVGRLTSLFFDAWMVSLAFAQIYRYRYAATSMQRQQTKWVMLGVVIGIGGFATIDIARLASVMLLGNASLISPFITWIIYYVCMLFVPLAFAMAILRARLYDIDILINRTLVYGALTLVLALAYFASVVLLQQVFRSVTGQATDLAVVASTLTIAALFTPLRRHIQTAIDRRFYRRKYDAARTLAAFSVTLRDEMNLNALTADLLAVVEETLQPAHVSLWLRRPQRNTAVGGRPMRTDERRR